MKLFFLRILTFLKVYKRLLTKKTWKAWLPWVGGVVGVFLLGVFVSGLFFPPSDEEAIEPSFRQVELQQLGALEVGQDTLRVLGKIQSEQQVDVRAEAPGQIVFLPIKKGERVEEGQVLMELNRAELDAKVLQARASLDSAQATLTKMKNGERPEDIAILEEKLASAAQQLQEMKRGARSETIDILETKEQSAQQNLVNAQKQLENAQNTAGQGLTVQIENARNDLQEAVIVTNKVFQQTLFEVIRPDEFFEYKRCELQIQVLVEGSIEANCSAAFQQVTALESQVESLPAQMDPTQTLTQLEQAQGRLNDLRDFLAELATVVDGVKNVGGEFVTLSGTDRNFYRNLVSSSQTDIENQHTALTNRLQSLQTQILANQTAVDAAQSAVDTAQQTVSNLEGELVLNKAGSTSEQLAIQSSVIEQLKLQLQVAQDGARPEDIRKQEAAVRQAQANLSAAVASRDKAIIRAPLHGVLVYLSIEQGDVVGVNEVVATVADLDRLEAQVYLTEEQRRKIDLGADVAFSEVEAKGVVTSLSPALEPDTQKLEVLVSVVEGSEELILGESLYVEIVQDHTQAQQRVPLTAIKMKGDQAFVFGVSDLNIITSRPVEIGRTFGDAVELLDGLSAEDSFIPDIRGLEEGEEVEVRITES